MLKQLFLVCLMGMSVMSFAAKPMTVMLDWYMNPDHVPLIIAQENAYFKQHGLDVTLIPPGDGVDPAAMLAAGKVDVAVSYEPYLLIDVSEGLPLVRIATLIDQPLSCVTVLKSSNIDSLLDLKGKTVAYSGGALSLALFQAMLAKVNLTLNQVKLINVQMNISQALIAGKVDASLDMMRNVEPLQLNLLGFKTVSFMPEDYGVPSYDELILVVRKDRANDPEMKQFVLALNEAMQYVHTYPDKSWDIAVKAYPNVLAQSSELANTNHQIWLSTVAALPDLASDFDSARYQAFVNFMVQHKLIKASLEPKDYNVSVVQ